MARARVIECKLSRVQKVAAKRAYLTFDRRISNRVLAPAAVSRVAYNRVAYVREVDSDLMRAASFDLDIEQGELTQSPRDFNDSMSRAARSFADYSHASSILGAAAYRRLDLGSVFRHATVGERNVLLEYQAITKLARQSLVREVVFRYDQQPRCFFVYAVNYTWANTACGFRKRVEVIDERIGERA